MKNLALIIIFFVLINKSVAQDCNPCIAVEQLHIISATERSDTESKLASGTTVDLFVQFDASRIIKIDADFSRILAFTDDKKVDLLKKGSQIEHMFETELKGRASLPSGGIQIDKAIISDDGHSLLVPVRTLAKPTNGAQTLLVEGQLGLRVIKDITNMTSVKYVDLSMDKPVQIDAEGLKIKLSSTRKIEVEGETFYIFSYTPNDQVISIHQSASGLKKIDISDDEFFTSSLDKVELIVETATSDLVEVPFTLKFGLGF